MSFHGAMCLFLCVTFRIFAVVRCNPHCKYRTMFRILKQNSEIFLSITRNMTVKERILEYCRAKGISIRQFEIKSQLSNGYVSSMRKSFGVAKLENVLCAFPDLSRDWLLYGEGEMLLENVKLEGTSVKKGYSPIPLFDCDEENSFPDIMNDNVFPSEFITIPGLKCDGAIRNQHSIIERNTISRSKSNIIYFFDRIDIGSISVANRWNMYLISFISNNSGNSIVFSTMLVRIVSYGLGTITIQPPGFISKENEIKSIRVDDVKALAIVRGRLAIYQDEESW